MTAVEQVDTLRAAVIALHQSGSATAILSAAARSAHWHPAVVERVRAQLPAFADQLGALGFDLTQLLGPTAQKAKPPTQHAPRHGFGAGPPRVPLDPALRAPQHAAPRRGFGAGPAAPATDPALHRGTPKPQHTTRNARPRHDVEIPTIPTLSAAAVLGQPSHKPPLEFEGTLDGLRGVPLDDLAGIRDDAGIGDKELERLTAAGIATVYDLMMRVPLRYIDRSEITPMSALRPGMKNVATVGKVLSTKADWGKKYARIEIGAGGYRVTSMQFQQPWLAQRFRRDDLVLMWGDVTEWEGFIQMGGALIAPMRDATAPFVPVYPQSDKHQVSTWTLHRAALDALRRLPALDDPLPEQIRTARQLPGRLEALRAVHVPDNAADATSGRDRLAYDELLRMQLAMGVQRNAARQQPAVVHAPTGRLTRPWLESLPWPLTGAQSRVLKEIAEDLRAPSPMKRLLQGDVGSGKAQPLDARVLTPDGFKLMGNMQIGDTVVTPCGSTAPVVGIYPQGDRDIYRLTFSDGTSVEADDEHLWVVNTSSGWHRNTATKTLTTSELRRSLTEKNGASRWHLPVITPVDLQGEGRPLDPYLMGLLLGDGGFSDGAVTFTNADKVLLDYVREAADHLGCELVPADSSSMKHGIYYRIVGKTRGINRVALAVRFLELMRHSSRTKFVPESYKQAPVSARIALLQGLMDTDGEIGQEGSSVALTLASERLIDDVAWVVYSLGGRAKKRVVQKRYRRADGSHYEGTYYRLGMTLPNDINPFRLGRKADRVRSRTKYAQRRRAIRAIEYVGRKPAQCILIDHPSHMYVTDNFTPTHNTKVALGAMLMAVEGGHQAALMAPIGVLVQQHYAEIAETCDKLGLRAVLVPGKNKPKARREALAGLASGEIHIAVGTTGLLSEDVQFKSLGLAVIDEQHRFGVNQRAALLAKGPGGAIADELGATATPIPRTAAMTQFGDVDISILDELPPGRTPIKTRWEPVVDLDDPNHAHWVFVRSQIAEGRQAFVVCPLVAEPETKAGQESEAQSAAAMETATALSDGALSGLRIAVVTGRQKPADRAEIMHAFSIGELDVLVATTVIEVGVSVPNATTITILDAGNFGLAQLHQLRGRVGRGKHPGFCVLTGEVSDIGRARMDAMCDTTDGFKLANVDLELRGPGALAGTAQAGHRAGLLVADLLADAELMYAARADAQQMLAADPQLLRRPTLRTEVERALGDDAHYLRRS
ncbi:MAG: helicase-related protein [Candidatus Nanopelagicales bacterium]